MDSLITKESLREAYPELLADIEVVAFDRGVAEGIKQGMTDGALAERNRIRSVEDQLIPGHEQLIQSLKYDGITTGPEAAVKILTAEKKIRIDMAAAISADAITPVNQPALPVGGEGVDSSLPVEERAKIKWDKSPELREEFNKNFDAYLAWLKQSEAGNVRILKKEKGGNE